MQREEALHDIGPQRLFHLGRDCPGDPGRLNEHRHERVSRLLHELRPAVDIEHDIFNIPQEIAHHIERCVAPRCGKRRDAHLPELSDQRTLRSAGFLDLCAIGKHRCVCRR